LNKILLILFIGLINLSISKDSSKQLYLSIVGLKTAKDIEHKVLKILFSEVTRIPDVNLVLYNSKVKDDFNSPETQGDVFHLKIIFENKEGFFNVRILLFDEKKKTLVSEIKKNRFKKSDLLSTVSHGVNLVVPHLSE
jgi:hypothetical protein